MEITEALLLERLAEPTELTIWTRSAKLPDHDDASGDAHILRGID